MSSSMRKLTTLAAAVSLMSVSTAAVSAAPAPVQAPVAAQTTVSPWVSLGAMSSSSTAASVAAAQDYDRGERIGWPPIAVLAIILATLAVGIYILVSDDDDDDPIFDVPVSPN